MRYIQDLFISHSGSDKQAYIAPLSEALSQRGVTFWLDDIEIAWGESISMKINEGLRTSRFILLCLSRNFLGRPWPEAEMGALLALQHEDGIKRALPLILDNKKEVLAQYPLLAGLAYREFCIGVSAIAEEIARLVQCPLNTSGKLSVAIESVHTERLVNFLIEPRVSIGWLRSKAQAAMEVSDRAEIGAYVPFMIRWVLVDTNAESAWIKLARAKKRKIHAALMNKEGRLIYSYSDRDRLEDLGLRNETVFHLYAIEDDQPNEYGVVPDPPPRKPPG